MAVKQVQATINGVVTTLTYNSATGKYEATLTAPGKTSWNETSHKYGITLKAEDIAGNITTADRSHATLGSNLQIRVLEKTKPVVSITSPSSGARVTNAKPAISFNVTDADSGVDITSLVFKIDSKVISNDAVTKTAITNGYKVTYTPTTALTDGAHTLSITITDNDGNISTTTTSSFTVDTNPPALNITAPQNALITKQASLTVTGTTNDATSSPVTVTITLNGTSVGNVDITSGAFAKEVALVEGVNTIVIKATDSAGLTSTVTRTVELDTVAPTIRNVTISKTTADIGTSFTISVEVTD